MNASHNSSNCTLSNGDCTEYLASWTIVILDIIYVFIVVIGLTGNIMTCAVTIMQKSMRRSIHLYVFNLAVCDLLILIFYVPNEMMRMENQTRYVWGPVMCVITYSVLPIAINGTVFTLLAISLDRARGIVRPFEWRNGPNKYPKIIIPIIWLAGISVAVPVINHAKLVDWNGGLACADDWPDKSAAEIYWYAMFAITFAIPLVIIFFLHILMIYMLAKEPVLVEQKANKKMIKMMIWIVSIFTVCTGSQHFYYFMWANVKMSDEVDGMLFFGSNLLVAVQSACNPILYGTFRQDFNLAFREFYIRVKKILMSYNLMICGKLRNPYSKVNMVTTAMVLRKQIPNGDSVATTFESQCSFKTPLINNQRSQSLQPTFVKTSQNIKDDHQRSLSLQPSFGKSSQIIKDNKINFDETNRENLPSKDDCTVGLKNRNNNNNNQSQNRPAIDSRPYLRGDIRKNTSTATFQKMPTIDDSQSNCIAKSPFLDIDSTQNDFPYDNVDSKSAEITKQILEISKLLNDLQRSEFLENYENRSRLSCEFLRLSDTEKNYLFSSYPSVDWLDFLTIQNSKETDL